ncbi:FAD-dependent oxidoreductase, partial [Mycolicibacterium sp.]|uniref:FAD-dependent oxidoreductase n=1 Tax=Mycolicibacterium sp. TaxID=2320850 RepID=UPI003D1046FB
MTTSEVSGGVVIVGGGLAAARTAEQLRRSEYAGAITIVSDEGHLPYDRPPLSKEVLRAETDDVTLKPAEFYTVNNITVLLGNGAKSVDTDSRTLTLADGT